MIEFKVEINKEELMKYLDLKLDEIADAIFTKSQEIIVEKNIIDEGTLLKTANINREFLSKTITYPVPYAEAIEFGRSPGTMPPFQAINAWVLRKGIASDEREASKIAWAICKNIEMEGIEPRPFLTPAIESVKKSIK